MSAGGKEMTEGTAQQVRSGDGSTASRRRPLPAEAEKSLTRRRARLSPARGLRAWKMWTARSRRRRPLLASGGPRARTRGEVVFRLRELIVQNRRRLAEVISFENGKTATDALGEVARGLENVEFACGIPNLLKGGYSEQASRGIDVYQIRQPLGVRLRHAPFNFPAMVPLWMFSTAIACGNTFVLKPSEKVPSASMALGEAGPRGRCFRTACSTWGRVTRLSSTGCWNIPTLRPSTLSVPPPWQAGIYGASAAAYRQAKCNGTGGAKDHMLVLPDADLAMSADWAFFSASRKP